MGKHARTEECPECGQTFARVGMVAHLAHKHGYVQSKPAAPSAESRTRSTPPRAPASRAPAGNRRAATEPEQEPEEIDDDELL